jgi:predicted nucleic acid-binding protein
MRIVVSDSSCIIDLRKVSLLDIFLKLPYEILIPDLLFEEELLKFTEAQKRALVKGGLKVIDMPGERVLRAQQVIRSNPRLSVHDGFAFSLAESNPGCILLTGDDCLRELALTQKIEVHGFLWIIDEMHHHELHAAEHLCAAVRVLLSDPAVRLPKRELAAFIKRYENLK